MKYWIETFEGEGLVTLASPHKDVRREWYWRIKAKNGQPLATSEGYTSKSARDKTVKKFAKATGLEVKAV